eukprot:768536-Hanusia_phi.AAC.12
MNRNKRFRAHNADDHLRLVSLQTLSVFELAALSENVSDVAHLLESLRDRMILALQRFDTRSLLQAKHSAPPPPPRQLQLTSRLVVPSRFTLPSSQILSTCCRILSCKTLRSTSRSSVATLNHSIILFSCAAPSSPAAEELVFNHLHAIIDLIQGFPQSAFPDVLPLNLHTSDFSACNGHHDRFSEVLGLLEGRPGFEEGGWHPERFQRAPLKFLRRTSAAAQRS